MTAAQHILSVELGDRSYPIYIGSGLLQQAQLLRQHITGKQVLIVTNDTIASLYLPTILKTLEITCHKLQAKVHNNLINRMGD